MNAILRHSIRAHPSLVVPKWFQTAVYVVAAAPSVILFAIALRRLWRRRGDKGLVSFFQLPKQELPMLLSPREGAFVEDDIPRASGVDVPRSFEDIRPPEDPPHLQRARLGPCSKNMLALIRIRFGVPSHTVANEEMIRRFIFQNADVYRGIRTTHLVGWVSTVTALAFVPSDHEYNIRRILTGNLTFFERVWQFFQDEESTYHRIRRFEKMMER